MRRIPPAFLTITFSRCTGIGPACSGSVPGLGVWPVGIRAPGRSGRMARVPRRAWRASVSTGSPRTLPAGCGSRHSAAESRSSVRTQGRYRRPKADPHTARPITLRRTASAAGGLSDDRVMALLTDHEGFVWAGTMEGGLDRIAPRTLAVKVFSHDANDPGSLGAPGVMSLLEDSARPALGGNLWRRTVPARSRHGPIPALPSRSRESREPLGRARYGARRGPDPAPLGRHAGRWTECSRSRQRPLLPSAARRAQSALAGRYDRLLDLRRSQRYGVGGDSRWRSRSCRGQRARPRGDPFRQFR